MQVQCIRLSFAKIRLACRYQSPSQPGYFKVTVSWHSTILSKQEKIFTTHQTKLFSHPNSNTSTNTPLDISSFKSHFPSFLSFTFTYFTNQITSNQLPFQHDRNPVPTRRKIRVPAIPLRCFSLREYGCCLCTRNTIESTFACIFSDFSST